MLAGGSTKSLKEFLKRFEEEPIKTHPPLLDYIEATTNSLQARVSLFQQVWLKTFGEMEETRDIDHLAFSAIMLGLPTSIIKYLKF